MEAVGEVEGWFGGNSFEEKGNEDSVICTGEVGIYDGKGFGEFAAHVGGSFHPSDNDFYFRVFLSGTADYGLEIPVCGGDFQSPQTVIGPQSEHKDMDRAPKHPVDAPQTARRSLAAESAVDDFEGQARGIYFFLKEGGIGFLEFKPVAGRQAVAQAQNNSRLNGRLEPQGCQQAKNSPHRYQLEIGFNHSRITVFIGSVGPQLPILLISGAGLTNLEWFLVVEIMTGAMDNNAILQVENLSKDFQSGKRTLTVLKGATFSVPRASTLAIVGPSGSGKTTLLGLCAGLDEPTTGSVRIDGVELETLSEDERALLRNRLVGFVFQSFQLIPTLTALENVMVPLELRGDAKARACAEDLLRQVGLEERVGHYPVQLSAGEQQRVALARAFINQPKLLFADEPTGNLDTETKEHVAGLLFDLNRAAGTTLVLVTHDSALAARTDRILHIENGRLREDKI